MSSTINIKFPAERKRESALPHTEKKGKELKGWHKFAGRETRHKLVNRGESALQLPQGTWRAAPERQRILARRVFREQMRPGLWSDLKRKLYLLKVKWFG